MTSPTQDRAPSPRADDVELLAELRTGFADVCARLRHVLEVQDAAAPASAAPSAGGFTPDPVVIDLVRASLAWHERRLADLDAAHETEAHLPVPARQGAWAHVPDRRPPIPGEWLG